MRIAGLHITIGSNSSTCSHSHFSTFSDSASEIGKNTAVGWADFPSEAVGTSDRGKIVGNPTIVGLFTGLL